MASWDDRDNTYKLTIRKLKNGYKIDGMMEVTRKPGSADEAVFKMPVPSMRFAVDGLGSMTFSDIEIVNGEGSVHDGLTQAGLHHIPTAKNLSVRTSKP